MGIAEANYDHGHEAEKDAGAGESKGQRQHRAARSVGNLGKAACECMTTQSVGDIGG